MIAMTSMILNSYNIANDCHTPMTSMIVTSYNIAMTSMIAII